MSCVLRIAAPDIERALARVTIAPYRVEKGTAHFDVSDAGFDELPTQIKDALVYLRANGADVQALMSVPGATGELDFATETEADRFESRRLPPDLVRAAGDLGLELCVSGYPAAPATGA